MVNIVHHNRSVLLFLSSLTSTCKEMLYLAYVTTRPRVLHGLPTGQNLKPAPALPNTRTLEAGRGFPALTGRGFHMGFWGYGGFPHSEGWQVKAFIHI